MPQGLQTWDANGVLTFDTNSRRARFFGSFTIGGAGSPQSGSLVEPRFSQGTPFHVAQSRTAGTDEFQVVVTITGDTLTWTYPASGSEFFRRPVTHIIYGVW